MQTITETILPALPDEGKANLHKLIAFLRELPPESFYFGNIVDKKDEKGCGTVCCAVGWMPMVFPDKVKWTQKYEIETVALTEQRSGYWEDVPAAIFGITDDLAVDLFTPSCQHRAHERLDDCDDMASPAEVADMLESYIALTETPAP